MNRRSAGRKERRTIGRDARGQSDIERRPGMSIEAAGMGQRSECPKRKSRGCAERQVPRSRTRGTPLFLAPSGIVATAAGVLTAEWHGNHRTGPIAHDAGHPVRRMASGAADFAWRDIFASDCPRFGRMDALCKVAVAAVETMGVDFSGMSESDRSRVGVCLGTYAGCVGTDVAYWRSRNHVGGPSPALFAYTLPSTAVGEICIRNRLTGPNMSLMLGRDGDADVLREAADMIMRGEAYGCLCLACEAVDEPAALALKGLAAIGCRGYALFLEREDFARLNGRSAVVVFKGGRVPGLVETAKNACLSAIGAVKSAPMPSPPADG